MNNQVNNTSLRENGFTDTEIERLNNLRQAYESKAYALKEESLTQDQQRRLDFARWLVLTGKMTESLI